MNQLSDCNRLCIADLKLPVGFARARQVLLLGAAALSLALWAGCTSDKVSTNGGAGDGGGTCSMPAAASKGKAVDRCGAKQQATSQSACHVDAGPLPMPPATDADGGAAPEFGETLYGMNGDDDDCKYHLSWTATPICENADVYFTVKVTTKIGDKPAKGADTMPDLSLGDAYPGDTAKSKTIEGPEGTYKIGPMRFGRPGKWTVRFHMYGDCGDSSEQSPHGHAAFFVDVP